MLKESTMKKYSVKQLVSHLVKKTGDKYRWVHDDLYKLERGEEGHLYYLHFMCLHDYQKDKLIELIKKET